MRRSAGLALVSLAALFWSPRGKTETIEPEAIEKAVRRGADILLEMQENLGGGKEKREWARMLVEYFEEMSAPKPFLVREGQEFKDHQRRLRREILEHIGLWPLPERAPLDVHETDPLDHPWCTVRRVYYQIWPKVYVSGLLYLPKNLNDKPAPGMLCPHGHWRDGHAHPVVQSRCLVFAKLGYVTFSPQQHHYEDLLIGISHQTLGVWSNMRALDYLESLPQVDRERIGVCGASGGGLQTQMLCALDPRMKAATIVGMTCNFREIIFPHRTHCQCNHFPGIMRLTDGPEISALALPVAVQYLTMNDWTKDFCRRDFPTVRSLYEKNGLAEHVDCVYESTEHTYDKSKREHTYRWMERWLRGKESAAPMNEPEEIRTFPPQTLLELRLKTPRENLFAEVSSLYHRQHRYEVPELQSREDWASYRRRMVRILRELLGEEAKLPRRTSSPTRPSSTQHSEFPSEGGIHVPTAILRPKSAEGRLPVTLICSAAGKDSLLKEKGPGAPFGIARAGTVVVLPDVRFTGELSRTALSAEVGPSLLKFRAASMLAKAKDEKAQASHHIAAWERNAITWGRPIPGMAVTDIRAVLDGLSSRADADMSRIKIVSRDSGELAIAVLFAAALDARIAEVDIDFKGCSFGNRSLPIIPSILRHGDVLEWAALAADRHLTLRNIPDSAGDARWLSRVFALLENSAGLKLE